MTSYYSVYLSRVVEFFLIFLFIFFCCPLQVEEESAKGGARNGRRSFDSLILASVPNWGTASVTVAFFLTLMRIVII